jgi:hypothetical protein
LKNTWHLYINFKSWLLLELKLWWLCCILGCFLFLKKLDTEINFYQDCIVLANVYQDTVKKLDSGKLIFAGTEILVALVELKNGHSLCSLKLLYNFKTDGVFGNFILSYYSVICTNDKMEASLFF